MHLKAILISFIFFQCFIFSQSTGKIKVAVTIDDLPYISSRTLKSSDKVYIYEKMLESFKKYNIKALGFVIGKNQKPNYDTYIHRFLEHGHKIGNHTFSHIDLNSTSLEKYIEDIEKCESVLKRFNQTKKYFRFTYLIEGNSKEKVDGIYEYFRKNDITPVPVSIPCLDVNYVNDFEKAYFANNQQEMEKIKNDYVKAFKDKFCQMVAFAKKHTKKEQSHIILFHMNLISAYTIEDLIKALIDHKVEFVDVDKVLQEEAYKRVPKYYGGAGYTWFERF